MHYAINILLLCVPYPLRTPPKQALKIFKNTSTYGTISGRPLPRRKMQSVGSRAVSDSRKDGTSVQSSYNQKICVEFEF